MTISKLVRLLEGDGYYILFGIISLFQELVWYIFFVFLKAGGWLPHVMIKKN